jgi:uncharacterized protein YqgC (DUF456 family)
MNFNVKHFFKDSIRAVLGSLLIILGIVGLFVPFLQGILLILLGLGLLGVHLAQEKFDVLKRWFKEKFT